LYPPEISNHSGLIQLYQELQVQKTACEGFVRIRIEETTQPRLYANHQGGYRVSCPFCTANIARGFSSAVEKWRRGEERNMLCHQCNESFSLENAIGRPSFAFASAAIVLSDVQRAVLGEDWVERCDALLGEYRIIYRRLG